MKIVYKPQIDEHLRSYFQYDVQQLVTNLVIMLSLEPATNELVYSLRMDATTMIRCTWLVAVVMTSMVKCSKSKRLGHEAIPRDELDRLCSKGCEFDIHVLSIGQELPRFLVQRPISMDHIPKRWYQHDRWTIGTHHWMGKCEIHAFVLPKCQEFPQCWPEMSFLFSGVSLRENLWLLYLL